LLLLIAFGGTKLLLNYFVAHLFSMRRILQEKTHKQQENALL